MRDFIKLILTGIVVLIYFFIAISVLSLILESLFESISLPSIVTKYSVPIISIVLSFFAPIYFFYKWLRHRTWGKMPLDEMKKTVFSFEHNYFDGLSPGHEAVQRFKYLISIEDIDTLIKEWKSLEKAFLKLEKASGHTGRPLIFDYYFEYLYLLKLLRKKMT